MKEADYICQEKKAEEESPALIIQFKDSKITLKRVKWDLLQWQEKTQNKKKQGSIEE